jgi:hypothetical protein
MGRRGNSLLGPMRHGEAMPEPRRRREAAVGGQGGARGDGVAVARTGRPGCCLNQKRASGRSDPEAGRSAVRTVRACGPDSPRVRRTD